MIFYLITFIYGCNSLRLKSNPTRLDANNVMLNTSERGGHHTPEDCSWNTLFKNTPDGYLASHCGYFDGGILGGTTDSLTECVQICDNTVDCVGFSHARADGQCYTYNSDTKWYHNPDDNADRTTGFAFKKSVGVICNDFPGWEDDYGYTCADYDEYPDDCWMEASANWDKSGPYYGVYPDQSCCICEGGQRRRIGVSTKQESAHQPKHIPQEEEEETPAPTTAAPTTPAPTTAAPTTQAPTTQAPTTPPPSQEQDTPVEVPFGHNCNCGARIDKFKRGKGSWELCHEACSANDNCKSFGVWTKRQKGLCALFDTVCTDKCPKPTKVNHRYLNDVYNM